MAGEGRSLPDGSLGVAGVKKARSRLVALTFCKLGSAARRLPLRSRVAPGNALKSTRLPWPPQIQMRVMLREAVHPSRLLPVLVGVSNIAEHSPTSGCSDRQAELWRRADRCRSGQDAFTCTGVRAPKGIRIYPLHQMAGQLADSRGVAMILTCMLPICLPNRTPRRSVPCGQ